MDFFQSPYLVTTYLIAMEQTIQGYTRDSIDVFGWKKVILNFPGVYYYNPFVPWVYKVKRKSEVTIYFYFYIDDGRPIACSTRKNWKQTQRVC